MEVAALVVGLLGLVPLAYFLYDRHARDAYIFELDKENTRFIQIDFPQSQLHGNYALAMYGCNIINRSGRSRTIKSVTLQYELGGKKLMSELHTVVTGMVHSVHEKKDVSTALVQSGTDFLFLMNWQNLGLAIRDHGHLEPGERISGSALFVFDTKDQIQIESIAANARIIIQDYSNGNTKFPLPTDLETKVLGWLKNRPFRKPYNEPIEFA